MTRVCPFADALDPRHRADPYPFYAQLPAAPVHLEDGRYVVSGYEEVRALLHDPRLSSAQEEEGEAVPDAARRLSLLRLDPPEHDRMRRIVMRQFGPPNRSRMVNNLEGEITEVTNALIDAMAERRETEVVEAFAHRLPIAIICRLFGIPTSAEDQFGAWVGIVVSGTGARKPPPESQEALGKIGRYLMEIAMSRRGKDGDDILSGLVNDDGPEGRLPERSVAAMATLLLIAGHETTVNLISNGILTLLRDRRERERLRRDPERAIDLVEELLRFEPPVQFLPNRVAMDDIEVGGVTIPRGHRVVLVLAAANRDRTRFSEAHRFEPDRKDNQHLGFGSGIHGCLGAPLARLEGQIALWLFFERVETPTLVREPLYRPSPLLRGPRELVVAYGGVSAANAREVTS